MSKDSFTWTIGGEAGFGINISGLIFSKTLTRSGFHIFDYIEYPSLIRGGHNVYHVHVGQEEVFSQEKGIDILVALNQETFELHKKSLKRNSFVIYDSNQFRIDKKETEKKKINVIEVPLATLIKKVGGIKLMENNIALGASLALLGLDLKALFSVIEDTFLKKGTEIVNENQKAAQVGYDFVRETLGDRCHPELDSGSIDKGILRSKLRSQNDKNREERLVLTGNEAIVLGCVFGGCQFFAAYPMTPASSILHTLAGLAEKVGMIVKHAEDEISVINMAIGAAFAGVRSAVATSGGGFSLMQESVSLAGMTETGIVIIECQRPAPATGMPTWTDQGDLQFILRSGHGDFPKIVLAPGDQEEAFYLTAEAFNLADIYQCPVFIISDKYLSESHKSINATRYTLHATRYKIDRGKIIDNKKQKTNNSYRRYKITDDGISPWILPGTPGYFYQANSYEHLEDGHTTESAEERVKQVDKRARKMKTFIKNHLPKPKVYGDKNADITFVGWGSTKMPVLQAMKRCNNETIKQCNYLHLNYLWPFPKESVTKVLKQAKRVLLLEGNPTSQLGQLIRQETGIEIKNKFLKDDGRPFYPEEILTRIKNL